MATADSSEVRLYYHREVTPGVTPASAPNEFRFSGESLSAETETSPNPEIRPGRQVQDEIRTRMEPRGGVNIVLSALSHDDLLEGVMTNTRAAGINISSTTIQAIEDATDTYVGTGNVFSSVPVGALIEVGGFTTPANNGRRKVIAKPDNNTLVVHNGTKGVALVDEAAGDTVTVKSRRLQNGSTKHYYTIEKRLSDMSPEQWFAYKGCLMGGFAAVVEPNRILEGSFSNIIGRTPHRGTATAGSGSPVVVSTNKVMDAINAVKDVWLGHSVSGLELQRLAFQIDNGLRGKPAIGVQGNADVALSDFSVTGELIAYFDGALAAAVYDQWLANDPSAITFTLEDADGNAFTWDFPTIKWQNIQVVAGSKGQDMVLNCRWRAIEDPTEGITASVTRYYSLA